MKPVKIRWGASEAIAFEDAIAEQDNDEPVSGNSLKACLRALVLEASRGNFNIAAALMKLACFFIRSAP